MEWLLKTISGGAGYVLSILGTKVGGLKFGLAIGFLVLVVVIDRFTGRRIFSWTRGMARSAGASIAIYLINFVVAPVLLLWAANLEPVYGYLHIPHVPSSVWAGMPIWLVAVVAVLAHDFANYWNHRAMHWRWIWPIHAIHHSDTEVTPLTTFRIHPFEGIFMWLSYLVLLSWLGFPDTAIKAGAIFVMLHNQYIHVNVDWNHGPLKMLISSPRFHRWHHADHPAAHGKNLANIFPLFDVIFGTYYNPSPCRERMGAEGVPEHDVPKLLLFPFTEWRKMIRGLFQHQAP